jgi:heme a synthase
MSNSTSNETIATADRTGSPAFVPSRGLAGFAKLTATATFVLIFVGGLVTSTGSAMAIPNWPLAFGRLVPKTFAGGIRFEYGHRVVAGVVVILTLALALWIWRAERRSRVRYTALAAFGLIIAQAILGGMTVLFDLPLPLAVAHAGTAQAFFCVMVALALVTSPHWAELTAGPQHAGHPSAAGLCAVTTAAIYLQILIGAVMRHMGAGLAVPDFPLNFGHIIPPAFTEPIAVNFAHRCGAIVVTIFVVWTAASVLRTYHDQPLLRRPAIGLLALLAAQISLGAITIWSHRAVIPTTAHVAVGAAVLATSFALTLRLYRVGSLAGAAAGSPVFEAGPTAQPKVSA